jgi:hypothetical protein
MRGSRCRTTCISMRGDRGYDPVFAYSLFKADCAAFLLVIRHPANQQSNAAAGERDVTASPPAARTSLGPAIEGGRDRDEFCLEGPRTRWVSKPLSCLDHAFVYVCTSPRSAFLYRRPCIICSYFSWLSVLGSVSPLTSELMPMFDDHAAYSGPAGIFLHLLGQKKTKFVTTNYGLLVLISIFPVSSSCRRLSSFSLLCTTILFLFFFLSSFTPSLLH